MRNDWKTRRPCAVCRKAPRGRNLNKACSECLQRCRCPCCGSFNPRKKRIGMCQECKDILAEFGRVFDSWRDHWRPDPWHDSWVAFYAARQAEGRPIFPADIREMRNHPPPREPEELPIQEGA